MAIADGPGMPQIGAFNHAWPTVEWRRSAVGPFPSRQSNAFTWPMAMAGGARRSWSSPRSVSRMTAPHA